MKVGFIGTGAMGLPMMQNVVKQDHAVTAFDLNPASLKAAVDAGATQGLSAAEVAMGCEALITILPSSSNVEACYLGPGGIAEGAKPGTLCIDMSTIDPTTSRRVGAALQAKGLRFIDAPVSGGVGGAKAGTLTIMVGGDAKDVEAARPLLAAMGTNVIHVGALGAGEVAKICNNLIGGVAFVAVSEAFRIGEAYGVDPKILTDVISKSSGGTWVMAHAHPVPGLVPTAPSSHDYAPGFTTDLMGKDLGLAVAAAREARVPLAVTPAAQQLYRLASAHGLGRKDCASVYTFLKPGPKESPV